MSDRITEQLDELNQKLSRIERALEASGILSPWQPPTIAANLVSESAGHIRQQILEARKDPKSSDLKCGVHYKFKGARILINVEAWKEYQAIPPERRKA